MYPLNVDLSSSPPEVDQCFLLSGGFFARQISFFGKPSRLYSRSSFPTSIIMLVSFLHSSGNLISCPFTLCSPHPHLSFLPPPPHFCHPLVSFFLLIFAAPLVLFDDSLVFRCVTTQRACLIPSPSPQASAPLWLMEIFVAIPSFFPPLHYVFLQAFVPHNVPKLGRYSFLPLFSSRV